MTITSILFHFWLFIFAWRCASSLSDSEGDVCISQGGRFSRFVHEGLPPRKSSKGQNDLTLCRVYRKKTCCTAAQTHPALISIRKLVADGEGSNECVNFWEAMECAVCDPRVGVKPGPPVLCSVFCDSLWNACRSAFFIFDTVSQFLIPCGPKDAICGRGSEWASNGSEFCQLCGFAVYESKDYVKSGEHRFCFDGRMDGITLEADMMQSSMESSDKLLRRSLVQRTKKLMKRLGITEKVLWAVGGLVLTAGVTYLRQRPNRKRAAMLRAVQEAKLKAANAADRRSRKGSRNHG